MRRLRSFCWARATSGSATAPPITAINFRRFMSAPKASQVIVPVQPMPTEGPHVLPTDRSGSTSSHVRNDVHFAVKASIQPCEHARVGCGLARTVASRPRAAKIWLADVLYGRAIHVELADSWTVVVGEYHRAACLDHSRRLRGHDIRAKIEFARRDTNHRDHDRSSKANHNNLKVGGSVCGIQRRIH